MTTILNITYTIENELQKVILRHYQDPSINIFDSFMTFCKEYYDSPASSLVEIRMKKNTKLRGDIFEHFAQKYLEKCYCGGDKFHNVWLLKEVPPEILQKLKLQTNDLGIDLIAETHDNKYFAIQAKYRQKKYKSKHGIPWQQLSTFYGLVSRSGPYEKHIVITNADWVRHVGRKTKKDLSICYGTLNKISLSNWCKLANFQEKKLNQATATSVEEVEAKIGDMLIPDETDIEAIREKRLKYLQKLQGGIV